jgi:hypothetical protein
MTSRILPVEEWSRLVGTELESIIGVMIPEQTTVMVVEDGEGAIVGTWALIRFLHAEGFWIRPDHRGQGSVLRRLIAVTRAEAHRQGELVVWTGAVTPDVEELLVHAGAAPLPIQHYLLPVNAVRKGESLCPQLPE